jgi:glucosamine-6-phosphate deaminase
VNTSWYQDALASSWETSKWEHVPVVIFEQPRLAAARVAQEVAQLVRDREADGLKVVLGLATGSTPIFVYQELARLHREEGLSFRNVITFNLDEYYPISPDHAKSYHRFMREHFFDHIDVPESQIHIPDGALSRGDVALACERYEKQIAEAGGIDLQILGIGRTGHIGFNEPGSSRRSATRLIHLDRLTRLDAIKDFQSEELVPRTAITMGVKTILQARRIVIMAFGEHKAPIVARSVEGEVTAEIPATYLQDHENCLMVLDEAAASQLTRIQTPWLVGPLHEMGLGWSDSMLRRAVNWLAQKTGKAILKLTDEDYNSHSLQELLSQYGNAYEINLRVFRQLQNTITGWPGGKPPGADKVPVTQPRALRSRSAAVYPKRILIFSPHPGDDVLAMGGTLLRLAEHRHEVHVAYQVSGSGSVKDEVLQRYLDFHQHVGGASLARDPSDAVRTRALKAAICRSEARAAARVCRVDPEHLHFLDLPFYEKAGEVYRQVSAEDIAITARLLQQIRPHQIYAAGDLADPHGTHRICLDILTQALRQSGDEDWFAACEAWLYRGAWADWPIHEVDMAVPLSPAELACKQRAFSQHESQREQAAFSEPDGRNPGQHAEDSARATSRLFDALGLPDYEAIETFHRWELVGDSTSVNGLSALWTNR